MKNTISLPIWSIAAPVVAWVLVLANIVLPLADFGVFYTVVMAVGLLASVLAAVFHAEVIAHKVGEPYGTLVLAVAVTTIEVALIVSLMIAGGAATTGLARDTVFAAVMIILNGIVGICLLAGAGRHGEQTFQLSGVAAALATLATISVLTMVLPNFTATAPGPVYSPSQLGFIALVSIILYGTFVLVQTVQHRDYFLPEITDQNEELQSVPPSTNMTLRSAALLLACLSSVVLLAKVLSSPLEAAVLALGAPKALVGIIIAGVVLLPEGIAAFNAARANRLQTSLNLALGSALASIGLTIPAVAIVSLATGRMLSLGIDAKSSVLLGLTLIVSTLSFSTGRTTIMQGTVHLVIFAVYLFTAIVP
jgi:Ca2+:H+ antiporter